MLKDFKQFILRGNVVDLAVGVVIGAAFNSVITALVKDLLTPFISIFTNGVQFADWTFHIGRSAFMAGDFLNQIIAFVIEAVAVFFFVVLPINTLVAKTTASKTPVEPSTKKCPYCFSEIPKPATKCAFCTADIK
jgi:large conductance mechanosensitive channel